MVVVLEDVGRYRSHRRTSLRLATKLLYGILSSSAHSPSSDGIVHGDTVSVRLSLNKLLTPVPRNGTTSSDPTETSSAHHLRRSKRQGQI